MLLLYFILLTFLRAKGGDPMAISKQMFAAFTFVNILSFYISNQLNGEKREGKQISKDSILYSLIMSEILAAVAAIVLFYSFI